MRFVADVHLHSRYSRATSRELNPENLHKWAALKGVDLVGTGDSTHPEWVAELKEKLEPAEDGLFQLRSELRDSVEADLPALCRNPVRFVLSAEISSIYKKNDRTRKVHNLVLLPDLDSADELNRRLGSIGNITSDGRPILGLDSRNLLEICLEVCADVLFIPAHIWTPHFAVLGASSGFESLEECFEDLLPHIPAVETGLSSDPAMNSRLSQLDRYAVVSNSDAHSPGKLAREATCFDTDMSYPAVLSALRDRDPARFTGTIEFYPEEGKYHYDGHRKCGVRWKPAQALAADGVCPECGRKLTVGVLHRVEKLADRAEDEDSGVGRRFEYLIPLAEIIGSALGVGPATKKVARVYDALLGRLGTELDILRFATPEEIAEWGDPLVGEGVRRMRAGEVHIDPGFDGEFGKIEVFTREERSELEGQARLFEMPEALPEPAQVEAAAVVEEMATDPANLARVKELSSLGEESLRATRGEEVGADIPQLDGDQQRAVTAEGGPIAVVAGPGSGKTRVLTHRIAHLIEKRGADPSHIAAVTFTNRAAGEMRQRLAKLLPGEGGAEQLMVGTFHRLSLDLARTCSDLAPRVVLDACESREILAAVLEEEGLSLKATTVQAEISRLKSGGAMPGDVDEPDLQTAYRAYQGQLAAYGACDFDDILLSFLRLLETSPEVLAAVRSRIEYLLVDEFQDVNAVQYRLVRKMTNGGSGLFVIGDPDQAIYGFRGADPGYFQTLSTDYADTQVCELRRNYRSDTRLVAAADGLMGREPREFTEAAEPLTDSSSAAMVGMTPPGVSDPPSGPEDAGPRVRLIVAPGEMAEGIAVVREINRMVGGSDMTQTDAHLGEASGRRGGYGFGDFAVFFRTARQAEVLETCFLTEGLPFRLIGQQGFLERRSVRDAVAFFWFVTEPSRGLRVLEALRTKAFTPGKAALAQIGKRLAYGTDPVDVESLWGELNGRSASKLKALWDTAARYRKLAIEEAPAEVLNRWHEDLGNGDDEAFERLVAMANRARSMTELLDTLLLGREADIERAGGATAPAAEAVKLMTMHAAKGLEFPVVFIAGVEEGRVPLLEEGKVCDEGEERRLFYVALTRAQEEVVLFRSQRRTRYGKRIRPEVSRFVEDIPEGLLLAEGVELGKRERAKQLSLF